MCLFPAVWRIYVTQNQVIENYRNGILLIGRFRRQWADTSIALFSYLDIQYIACVLSSELAFEPPKTVGHLSYNLNCNLIIFPNLLLIYFSEFVSQIRESDIELSTCWSASAKRGSPHRMASTWAATGAAVRASCSVRPALKKPLYFCCSLAAS